MMNPRGRGLARWGWTVLLAIGTLPALAQLPTATILGVVKDSSGAVVPGAALTVRNVETGLTRTTVAGADGSYRFAALPVGPYEVRVEHTGFRAELRTGLALSVSQEAVIDFALQVGAVAETVSVTAEAPQVNTTSGSLGTIVDERQVTDLPLDGRNYIDLTLLQPGVTHHRPAGDSMQYAGRWFSTSGAPMRSNNFMLDGAVMTNVGGVSTATVGGNTLGLEGIREYRVETNSFSAEYGLSMGSQMQIVSRGGTNEFHGSLFEYLRNSALDARNFFDYKTGLTPRRLPGFVRNNFGGAFGGPILRDRTFFHATMEAVRERKGTTPIANTLPAAARIEGIANGGLVNQIHSAVKPLVALYPEPNLPNNRFTYPYSQPVNEVFGQARVDHNFSELNSMFFRYTITDGEKIEAQGFPGFTNAGNTRNQFATFSQTHVFSPTMLNLFRFSWSHPDLVIVSPPPELVTRPEYQFLPGQAMGSLGVTGLTAMGPGSTYPRQFKQDVFSLSDDVSFHQDRATWRFGILVNRYRQFVMQSFQRGGAPSFPSIPAFLQGLPNVLRRPAPDSVSNKSFLFYTLGFYMQNDLRVHQNLNLNLGLRYEFQTEMNEVNGFSSAIRDLRQDSNATLGRPFVNPSKKNFSPRFGFAWDVRGDSKTAVRGGFGLLYDLANLGTALVQTVTGTPPFAGFNQVNNPGTFAIPFDSLLPADPFGRSLRVIDYNLQQPHMLQYNLSIERQLPFDTAVTLSYAGSRGINLLGTMEGNPAIPQVRPDGRLFWPAGAPRVNPRWADTELKTAASNSFYNSLQFRVVKRMSRGLQFNSAFTWSKLIDEPQALGSVDVAGADYQAGSNPFDRRTDRGLASFDVKYNWRFNAIYQLPQFLPGDTIAGKLLNDWQIGGILSFQGGQPLTLGLSSNRSRSQVLGGPSGVDRPDLVAGVRHEDITQGVSRGCGNIPAGTPVGTPERWFDPCAFAIPEAGFLGNAGRGIIRTPGLANVDFSLTKAVPLRVLGEGGRIEFRSEFFNILNHVNFGVPSRNVYAGTANVQNPIATAGQITRAGTSRQIQLALRLVF